MGKKIEVTKGQRFGRWTVIEEVDSILRKGLRIRVAKCVCDCGTQNNIRIALLRQGNTKSCGCYNRDVAHNQKGPLFGVGVNDYDYNIRVNGDLINSYKTWVACLRRCYYDKALKIGATYAGCSVCDNWLRFTNFKRWFDEHYIEGYALDKDILQKGNKIYSPDTCCFVPQEINSLLVSCRKARGSYPVGVSKRYNKDKFEARAHINGKCVHIGDFNTPMEAFNAYKTAKEAYIKEVADKWRGKIANNVYQALYNYEIEITD